MPRPRVIVVTGVTFVVLLAAALLPVPGALQAAVAGVVPAVVALRGSVRDAVVAVVVGSALLVIGSGAGGSVILSVVFMGAVALGVAAALRVGRAVVACAIAAQLSIHVVSAAELGTPLSVFSAGGIALASGLVICGVAVFAFPWWNGSVLLHKPSGVVLFAAFVVPFTMAATWVCISVVPDTQAWWLLVCFFVVLMPIDAPLVARVVASIAGACLAGLVVAIAGGTPVLVAIAAVVLMVWFALSGRQGLFAAALTTVIVLVGSPDAGPTVLFGVERFFAAVIGSAAGAGVAVYLARTAPTISSTPSAASHADHAM